MDKMDKLMGVPDQMITHPELHKFWGVDEYHIEHLSILKEREKKRFEFFYQAPQIESRETLVELLKKIAVYKKLGNNTIHFAVYLLDIFMDNYNIISDLLHLAAFVCLLLASKFEERDVNHLRFADINKLVNSKYSLQSYTNLECCILKLVNWNLLVPTTVQFVDIFCQFLLHKEDLKYANKTMSELWFDAKTNVQGLLDHILEDLKLMQSKPSIVAAAVMATTRIMLGLLVIWPARLKYITGYQLFDLKYYITNLRKKNVQFQISDQKA